MGSFARLIVVARLSHDFRVRAWLREVSLRALSQPRSQAVDVSRIRLLAS